jgi:DNA-binding response OmpR family regulator
MVAAILVAIGLIASDLESSLKVAGWAPRRVSDGCGAGELDAQLKATRAAPADGNRAPRIALIAAVNLLEADRVVEQVIGQCSRVRVVLVVPDSIDREARRALVRALRAGADDFVTVGAVSSELALRLGTGRGRSRRRELTRLQRICGLQLDRGFRHLRHADRSVSLTPCEYRVFSCLARRPGHVVSRTTIQRDLLRRSRSASKNMVDVYVLYLRRKLAQLECSCSIRTIRGVGYSLTDEPVETPNYEATLGSYVPTHLEG